ALEDQGPSSFLVNTESLVVCAPFQGLAIIGLKPHSMFVKKTQRRLSKIGGIITGVNSLPYRLATIEKFTLL
ncbi:MAG: hypothetical protein ACP5HJ_04035, partial [Candidatus Micrarchaeia archaeon]